MKRDKYYFIVSISFLLSRLFLSILQRFLNSNLAKIFKDRLDYQKAIEFYNRSIAIDGLPNHLLGSTLYNKLFAHRMLGQVDSVDICILRLNELSAELSSSTKCRFWGAMSGYHRRQSKLDSALLYLDLHKSCARIEKSKRKKGLFYFKKGLIYYDKKEFEIAEESFNEAKSSFAQIENFDEETIKDVHLMLFKTELSKRKDSLLLKDFEHLADLIQYVDYSIIRRENKSLIESYQTKERKNEILILEQERKLKEIALKEKNAYLLGAAFGISGLLFGLYFLYQKRKSEKSQFEKEMMSLQSDNKKLYDKVQRSQTTKEPIQISDDDQLYIRDSDSWVPLKNVAYIENYRNYQTIHTNKGEQHIVRSTMQALSENFLPSPPFVRIHSSYVANLNFLKRKSATKVDLKIGYDKIVTLNIGRAYKDKVKNAFELMPEEE